MSDQRKNRSGTTGWAVLAAAGIGTAIGYLAHQLFTEINSEEDKQHQQQSHPVSTSSMPIQPPKICSICLEELSGSLEQLPCMHLFHRQCVLRLLATSAQCPICRQTLSPWEVSSYRERCSHA